jgi:hypothetical protein
MRSTGLHKSVLIGHPRETMASSHHLHTISKLWLSFISSQNDSPQRIWEHTGPEYYTVFSHENTCLYVPNTAMNILCNILDTEHYYTNNGLVMKAAMNVFCDVWGREHYCNTNSLVMKAAMNVFCNVWGMEHYCNTNSLVMKAAMNVFCNVPGRGHSCTSNGPYILKPLMVSFGFLCVTGGGRSSLEETLSGRRWGAPPLRPRGGWRIALNCRTNILQKKHCPCFHIHPYQLHTSVK